uniref:Coiled-coil domain-containing protein 137 n=1 Tax=Panagrolaimus sp. PS1159 TaxID=55785 RepID=A0AC35G3Q8_9BILA
MGKIADKSLKSKRDNVKSKVEDEGYVPIRSKKNFKLNKAPKSTDMEEQYVPRKVREIKELQEAMKNQNKRSKLKKNFVVDEARKHGFERRPWEDNRSFTKRIGRETRDAVNLEMLKVRHAMAGRDINEIREDYKQLDEAAKRKKALKIMRREKLAKLKSKGKIADDQEENDDDDENGEVEEKPKKVKKQVPEKEVKIKKLTKNERMRKYKTEAKDTEKRELLLNAREVIQFGERVDAPPKFSAKFRKEFDPLFANAGSKDLLLKKLMEKNAIPGQPISSPIVQVQKNSNVSAEERQRVIDMHRALKKAGKQKYA